MGALIMAPITLTREDLEETKQHFAPSGRGVQWHAMAMEVILRTLGPEWWKKNCTTTAIKPDEFLAVLEDSEDNNYTHHDRIVQLGHMLYVLKECKGYSAFISSLKKRDLAPAFFELQVACLLYEDDYVIEFVETKGQKGEDYDLIAKRDETHISIEVKSRREGVVLNEKTLSNRLAAARKQLPVSGPSMIFVSIPHEWTMDKNAESVIGDCVNSFFRNSSRVNYIVLIWQIWIDLEAGRASALLAREYENPHPRTPVELGPAITSLKMPIKWDPKQPNLNPSFW
jgi:hypothetical protein